jgi:hypothetical protein
MKKIFLVLIFFTSLYFVFSEIDYEPKVGDNILLIFHTFKHGMLNDAKDFFQNSFVSNLKNPGVIKNILYLENIEDNEIVMITFTTFPANNDSDLSKDFYYKEVKSKVKAQTMSASFRLLTVCNEKYEPKIGDTVVIWEYNYKLDSVDKAIESFDKIIYPILSKEKQTKKSYLLSHAKLNVYAGITMYNGVSDDIIIMRDKIKELDPFFKRKSSLIVYKVIDVN